jgi:hypothetical protein
MGWAGNNTDATCPFINGEDHRCDQRLTLRRLDQAFTYCLGGFLACPTYQQLSWEGPALDAADDSDRQPAPGPTPRRLPPAAEPGPRVRLVDLTLGGRPAPAGPADRSVG